MNDEGNRGEGSTLCQNDTRVNDLLTIRTLTAQIQKTYAGNDNDKASNKTLLLQSLELEIDLKQLNRVIKAELLANLVGLKDFSLQMTGRYLNIRSAFIMGKHQTIFTVKGYLYKSLENQLTIIFYDPFYYGALPTLHYELLKNILWNIAYRVNGTINGSSLKMNLKDVLCSYLSAKYHWILVKKETLFTNFAEAKDDLFLFHLDRERRDEELSEIHDLRLMELVEARSLYQRGDDLIEARKYDEAESYFKAITTQKFYNSYALHQLISLYLIDAQNLPHRIEQVLVILQVNPTNFTVLNTLASLYILNGTVELAIGIYQRLADLLSGKPHYRQDNICAKLAVAELMIQANSSSAIHYLEEQLGGDDSQDELKSKLIEVLRKKGDWQTLIPILEEEVKEKPGKESRIELLKDIAFIYLDHLEDYRKAKEFFQRLFEKLPKDELNKNLNIVEGLARCHEGLGNPKKAEAIYNGLLKKIVDDPYKGQIHHRLARLLMKVEPNGENAYTHFAAAHSFLPDNIEILTSLISLLKKRNEPIKFARCGEKLARLYIGLGEIAKAVEIIQGAIEVYLENTDQKQALRLLFEVSRLDPDNEKTVSLARRITIEKKVPSELLQQIADQVISMDEVGDLSCYYPVVVDHEDWQIIIKRLKQQAYAIEEKTHKARLLFTIGIVYEDILKDRDKANEYYQTAVKSGELSGLAFSNTKKKCYRDGNYLRLASILEIERSLTVKPSLKASLLYELGTIYGEHLGDQTRMLQSFEEALKTDIDSYPFFKAKREALLAKGEVGIIVDLIKCEKKFVQNDIFRPFLLHDYGRILLSHREYSAAEKVLKKAISIDGTNITTMETLGQLYIELNQYLSAVKVFHKIYQLIHQDPSVRPTDTLALNFVRIVKFQKNFFDNLDVYQYSRDLLGSYPIDRSELIDVVINYALGTIHQYKFVKIEKAKEFYFKSISLFPAHLYAIANLTHIFKLTNNFKDIETIILGAIDFISATRAKEIDDFLRNIDEFFAHYEDERLSQLSIKFRAHAENVLKDQVVTSVGEKSTTLLLSQINDEQNQLEKNIFQPERILKIANISKKINNIDSAYTFYSLYALLNPKDKQSNSFIEEYKGKYSESIPDRLSWQLLNEYVLHPDESNILQHILRHIGPILVNLYDIDVFRSHNLSTDNLVSDSRRFAFKKLFDHLRNFLDLSEIQLFTKVDFPEGIVLEISKPPSLIVSADWLQDLSPSEMRFLFGKHLFMIKNGHYLLQKLGTENFRKIIQHLCKMYLDYSDFEDFDETEYQQFAREFKKREELTQVEVMYGFLRNYLKIADDLNFEQFLCGMSYSSDRIGLITANDIRSAVKILNALEPELPTFDFSHGPDIVAQLKKSATIEALLAYAISDQYTKIRRIMNISIE